MTTDEAMEVLGGLVAAQGGEGDDALDHVKDQLSLLRVLEEGDAQCEYMVCVGGACVVPEDEVLPLSAAVARMNVLAGEEGVHGAAAEPVQLIAYTHEAVAQMGARADKQVLP